MDENFLFSDRQVVIVSFFILIVGCKGVVSAV
jgi:hypothetical protein